MTTITLTVEGGQTEIIINDAYKELWEQAIKDDDYDGPEEFEEWAATLIMQNANQIEGMIEEAANGLYQQSKAETVR